MADDIGALDKEREELIAQITGAKESTESPPEASEGSEQKPAEGQPLPNKETADSEQAAKPEVSKGEGEGDVDETKLESRYEKLKKAEARQAKTWQKIDSERETLKAERAALDQQKAEIERAREDYQRRLADDAVGKSPDMYRRAAENFRAEGEEDLAAKAEEMAQKLEKEKSEAVKNTQVSDLKKQWDESVKKAISENPELNNSESELFKEVTGLLRNKPVLGTYPEGFNDALEVSKAVIESRKVSVLEKQNSELKAELEKYKELTELGSGGGSFSKPGSKKLEDMGLDELRDTIVKSIS